MQSAISKRIDNDETESIFTTVSCLQSLLTMISIFIFAATFNATVDSMVGISFQIGAMLVIISLISLIWVDLNRLNDPKNPSPTIMKKQNYQLNFS